MFISYPGVKRTQKPEPFKKKEGGEKTEIKKQKNFKSKKNKNRLFFAVNLLSAKF